MFNNYNLITKGGLKLNKILFGVTLAGISAAIASTAVLAAPNSKIIITVGDKDTQLTYNVASGVTAELPLDSDVFSITSANSTAEYTEKEFSLTSAKGNSRPVDIKLVFTSQSGEELEYSALEYYDIKIADENGEYIYNCEEDELTDVSRNEIDLGTFNTQFTSETKNYTLYYKLNPEASSDIAKSDAAKLKIVVEATEEANTVTAVSPATAAPATSKPTTGTVGGGTTNVSTATPAPVPTATVDPDELSEKTYVCGKDIDPGKYLVEGNASITIKDSKGKLLKEVVVSDGSLGDFGGVEKFLVTLEKGDTITVKALVPDVKASVDFKSVSTSPSASPKPTATAKAAAASSSSKNSSSKNSSSTSSKTTNPKTGDNSVAVPALIAVMLMSGGFVGGLEVLKRRNFSAD